MSKPTITEDQQFIEDVFEIAFGDNAFYRDFSKEEVLKQLREDSDKVAEMEIDEDEQHLKELQEQGLNGYDKIESDEEVYNA